jgi:hypothetical protein
MFDHGPTPIGFEQQRREDAKKALGTGKFGSGFAFTCEVGVSDFGEMTRIALFSAFASSRLRCSVLPRRNAPDHLNQQYQPLLEGAA